jgi:hypothetical protein
MAKKLIRILNFIALFLITLCLSIFLEHVSFAQVPAERRIPQPEPFPSISTPPSTSPPVKCIPEASQKASWLLPGPTNNILWKNLRSNRVSVWVPYKYQLSNNFQAQQPVLPGTIVFQSDDRLKAIVRLVSPLNPILQSVDNNALDRLVQQKTMFKKPSMAWSKH